MTRKRWTRGLLIATHVAALLPLLLLALAYARGTLSVNPIRAITLRTGRIALVLLLLSLACTPVNILFGFPPAIAVRKPLGLYAALYAGLHFAVFAAWDYGLQFELIWLEIRGRPYIQVGLLALLIFVPLAITSTRWWMRRLGKNWKRLHRTVYLAGALVVLHYFWVVKADRRAPLVAGAVLLVLLAIRLPVVARALRGQTRNPMS